MERDIAARTFRYVPAGQADPASSTTRSHAASSGALGGAASAAGRGAAGARRRGARAPSARCRPPRAAASASRSSTAWSATASSATAARWPSRWRVRVDGLPVAPERAALAAAFPAATPRLVVFVHGLMEQRARLAPRRRQGREDYGTRLAARPRLSRPSTSATTAAATSPRTGARWPSCSTRGRRPWPVAVEEVALVGHSMGGLVSRSAAHIAALEDGMAWVEHVRKVVSLGSPHMGAPLEQAVHYAAFGAQPAAGDAHVRHLPAPPQLGHPRPAPGLAGRRGLARARPRGAARRRLRGGAAARGRDALLRLRHRDPQPAPPARARSSATRSCWCRARRAAVAHPQARLRGRVRAARRRARNHIALLNHPAVYEKLRAWLR